MVLVLVMVMIVGGVCGSCRGVVACVGGGSVVVAGFFSVVVASTCCHILARGHTTGPNKYTGKASK